MLEGNRALKLKADVLVAGGGTAGSAAAVAAARRGAKVLLVEEQNCLGGVSTAGGVSEWFASLDGMGDVFACVADELSRFGARSGRFYNGEYLKIVWQLLAQQAGVEVLLHASVADAQTDGGRIVRALGVACSRPVEVQADWFIDATGEGDLAACAGAEFMQGDPESGATLHMTLTFMLSDTGMPAEPYLPPGIEPIESWNELPGLRAHARLPDGRVYCNMTKVMGKDPTDPLALSRAEQEARLQLLRVVHFLQRTRYQTFTLAASGATIGIREGRRIVGDYVLREEDITGGAPRAFEDGVAVATSQIDFHSLTEPGHAGRRERVQPYGIPFRCLVAKGWKNLLVAGKCLSADQVAQSSARMIPTCCAMGQAAGTAAAMAAAEGLADVRALDVGRLREQLTADGIELDPAKHKAFAPEAG